MNEAARAAEVKEGRHNYICSTCGDKYREPAMEPYDGSTTMHQGKCYICEKQKSIGSSKKLLGTHIFI